MERRRIIEKVEIDEVKYCVSCWNNTRSLVSERSGANDRCSHHFCIPCLIKWHSMYPLHDVCCHLCSYSLSPLMEKYITDHCDNCGAKYYIERIEKINDHLCPNCEYVSPSRLIKDDIPEEEIWI